MTDWAPSKNAIDRLGGRLRVSVTPDDLRMLDTYRLSFASAYEVVLQQVRITHGLEVSGRPAKSTTAIVDKLKRESIRLSQMQDIAGCRVVVPDIAHQNALSEKLSALFSNVTILIGAKSRATDIEQFTSWCESKIVTLKYRFEPSYNSYGLNYRRNFRIFLVLR